MKNKLIIFGIIIISLHQCKGQSNNNIKAESNIKLGNMNVNIESILEKQLEKGAESFYDDGAKGGFEITTRTFEMNELDATIQTVQEILKSRLYKKPTNQEFNNKIKLIFGRIINPNSENKYLYVNYFDKCDRELILNTNNIVDFNGTYIIKEENIISDFYKIPELIDYQKEYSVLAKKEYEMPNFYIEDESKILITKWKDYPNLSEQRFKNLQTVISRNKYLFNDDRASFTWLKFHDTYFLESLVTNFGYTKDYELLDWVMKNNISEADEFVKNNVFVKDCMGKLVIREDILKYIEKNSTSTEQRYLSGLSRYYDSRLLWSGKDYYKVLAYYANTYDYIYMNRRKIGGEVKDTLFSVLGAIFYYSNKDDGGKEFQKIKDNFKENNYYNLPHLKQVLEYAYNFENINGLQMD